MGRKCDIREARSPAEPGERITRQLTALVQTTQRLSVLKTNHMLTSYIVCLRTSLSCDIGKYDNNEYDILETKQVQERTFFIFVNT